MRDRTKFYLDLAVATAALGTCPRAKVGAVLVLEGRVISSGYNGAPRGLVHCEEDSCWLIQRGNRVSCARTIHAELNAILNACLSGVSVKGATLYCTHSPCVDCLKVIIQMGIKQVYCQHPYADILADKLIRQVKELTIKEYHV